MEGDMDKRGFSLMELNVCCVVIAILAAVSLPLFADMRQAAVFRSEVRQLYSSLQQAKIEAIKQNSPVVFTLSPEGYTVFIDNGAGGGGRGDWIRQSGEEIVINHRYCRDVRMASTTFSGNRGRFRPRPGITGGRIILEDVSGSQQEVVLNVVGRIRVARL